MNNSKMTIKRNNSKAVPFEELKIGEVFEGSNLDKVFMKIELLDTTDSCSTLKNAIDLESGIAYRFYHGDKVFRFKATLMED